MTKEKIQFRLFHEHWRTRTLRFSGPETWCDGIASFDFTATDNKAAVDFATSFSKRNGKIVKLVRVLHLDIETEDLTHPLKEEGHE